MKKSTIYTRVKISTKQDIKKQFRGKNLKKKKQSSVKKIITKKLIFFKLGIFSIKKNKTC